MYTSHPLNTESYLVNGQGVMRMLEGGKTVTVTLSILCMKIHMYILHMFAYLKLEPRITNCPVHYIQQLYYFIW